VLPDPINAAASSAEVILQWRRGRTGDVGWEGNVSM
jgi:hypothetical protein